jgi:hypothetical protein
MYNFLQKGGSIKNVRFFPKIDASIRRINVKKTADFCDIFDITA